MISGAMVDLMDEAVFREKLRINLDLKNRLFEKYYGVEGFDYDEILQEYLGYAEQLRPYVKDTDYSANAYVTEGKKVLFEGAQATMLDLDHGAGLLYGLCRIYCGPDSSALLLSWGCRQGR